MDARMGGDAASVCARLELRRPEVEEAIFRRVWAVSGPTRAEQDEYAAALRTAISASVDHGLVGVERGADRVGPVPAALRAEARQAARSGVDLDVELRRYFVGYVLFCDFVIQAAEVEAPSRRVGLSPLLRTLGVIFDRLLVTAIDEYRREAGETRLPSSGLHLERVKMLLAGELAKADELAYEFDDWHVGVVACGDSVELALREVAEAVDRRILLLRADSGTIWAWFAGRRRIDVAVISTGLSGAASSCGAAVALGEPARGIEGWRMTHEQASAAFVIARRRMGRVVRYSDVGLVASISRDRLVASSLRQLYLTPLASGRDDGAAIRDTLRAYFRVGRNVSSAASALGISRQTVGNRLRTVEEKLGRTIESCAPELELALRLHELGVD